MRVMYPEKNEPTMQKGTRHPNEELGGANVFPEKQESIQTYPRKGEVEHPDEAMADIQEPEVSESGQITERKNWPKTQQNVKEYPRNG